MAADLLGGLFHWWEDRVATEDLPIIGPYVITPNRHHHLHPKELTEGMWNRNWAALIVIAVLGGAWSFVFGFSLTASVCMLGLAVSSEVHYLCHQKLSKNVILRTLQEVGVIQSPANHWQHHKWPADTKYCVLTNWLNPLLDNFKIWHGIEYVMTGLGFAPNKGTK